MDKVWILAAFVVYLLVMIVIGALYLKRTKNSEERGVFADDVRVGEMR